MTLVMALITSLNSGLSKTSSTKVSWRSTSTFKIVKNYKIEMTINKKTYFLMANLLGQKIIITMILAPEYGQPNRQTILIYPLPI